MPELFVRDAVAGGAGSRRLPRPPRRWVVHRAADGALDPLISRGYEAGCLADLDIRGIKGRYRGGTASTDNPGEILDNLPLLTARARQQAEREMRAI
ncbi:MAG: hypothetical protein ACSLE1_06040 [Sphingobium sp.]